MILDLKRGQNFEKRVTLALASFREPDLFDRRKPVVAFDDGLFASVVNGCRNSTVLQFDYADYRKLAWRIHIRSWKSSLFLDLVSFNASCIGLFADFFP